MTTHHLPAEPDVDVVWTIEGDGPDPVVHRWHRTGNGWARPGTAAVENHSWTDLLLRGAVSDTHPDLPEDAPTPWTWDYESGITDAYLRRVHLTDDETLCLIVRAVNAYAERLLGEGR